jgi:hypothetical protein
MGVYYAHPDGKKETLVNSASIILKMSNTWPTMSIDALTRSTRDNPVGNALINSMKRHGT